MPLRDPYARRAVAIVALAAWVGGIALGANSALSLGCGLIIAVQAWRIFKEPAA
ncbi:MAG TPA: hypothetical protein VMU31_04440 [Rhizomicrobium sp.]|nr:hypothetical protein [Rhizomicrobium sp.]